MLPGLHIEHELGERAMQPRHRPLQNRKARAGNCGRRLEIEAEPGSDLVMLQRPEVEMRHLAMHMDDDIGFLVRAVRRSEEHTSELQSLMRISYAVFCLKKKKHTQ